LYEHVCRAARVVRTACRRPRAYSPLDLQSASRQRTAAEHIDISRPRSIRVFATVVAKKKNLSARHSVDLAGIGLSTSDITSSLSPIDNIVGTTTSANPPPSTRGTVDGDDALKTSSECHCRPKYGAGRAPLEVSHLQILYLLYIYFFLSTVNNYPFFTPPHRIGCVVHVSGVSSTYAHVADVSPVVCNCVFSPLKKFFARASDEPIFFYPHDARLTIIMCTRSHSVRSFLHCPIENENIYYQFDDIICITRL